MEVLLMPGHACRWDKLKSKQIGGVLHYAELFETKQIRLENLE